MLVHSDFPRTTPSTSATGGDPEFTRWVPTMWRAMADPQGSHLWPVYPVRPTGPTDGPSAWWTPALHLILYSLAWPHPDFGLRRWIDADCPTEDNRLALLAQMLGERVDELAAFEWTTHGLRMQSQGIASTVGATNVAEAPLATADARWLESVRRAHESDTYRLYDAASEADVLHVSFHAGIGVQPWDETEPSSWCAFDSAARRAVVIVESYGGWYAELARHGAALPDLPFGSSWHVDVVCRAIGELGTYRRSRVTGRWFAGPHRVHQVGNAHASSDEWSLT